MIFSEAYEGSIYTGEKWQLLYPNNMQNTGHIGLLHKLIVGITDSRLSKVAYHFNVQISKADQTIEKLVASMIIGETALPIEHFEEKCRSLKLDDLKCRHHRTLKNSATLYNYFNLPLNC